MLFLIDVFYTPIMHVLRVRLQIGWTGIAIVNFNFFFNRTEEATVAAGWFKLFSTAYLTLTVFLRLVQNTWSLLRQELKRNFNYCEQCFVCWAHDRKRFHQIPVCGCSGFICARMFRVPECFWVILLF
jgi:hypothetical protein